MKPPTREEIQAYLDFDPGPDSLSNLARAYLHLLDEKKAHELWIDDLQSGMYINCVYCGHRYGPNTETPSMRDVLKKHVEKCPKHPMAKLKKLALAVVEAVEAMLSKSRDGFEGTSAQLSALLEATRRFQEGIEDGHGQAQKA